MHGGMAKGKLWDYNQSSNLRTLKKEEITRNGSLVVENWMECFTVCWGPWMRFNLLLLCCFFVSLELDVGISGPNVLCQQDNFTRTFSNNIQDPKDSDRS